MLSHYFDLFLQRKKSEFQENKPESQGEKNALVRIASFYYYTHNSDLISRNCKFLSYNFEEKKSNKKLPFFL